MARRWTIRNSNHIITIDRFLIKSRAIVVNDTIAAGRTPLHYLNAGRAFRLFDEVRAFKYPPEINVTESRGVYYLLCRLLLAANSALYLYIYIYI